MNHDCNVLPKKRIWPKYHSAIFLTEFKSPNHPTPPPPSTPHFTVSRSCRAKGQVVALFRKYAWNLSITSSPHPPPPFSPPERLLTNSFFSKLISAFYNYCHSCEEQSLSNDRIERTCWEISCFATKCAFVSKQPSRTDEEIGQSFDILKENCWQAFNDWSPTFLLWIYAY